MLCTSLVRARRQGLGLAIALVVLGLTLGLAAPSQSATPLGLRDYAGDFLIGYASRSDFWALPDSTQYQQVAAREFNMLTPEVQMKWSVIHPARDGYNFAPADQHVAFAERHQMQVHGHTLVWHTALPPWLTNNTWTAAELEQILADHIAAVAGRYRGRIALWDVVNEGFNQDGTYRNSLWRRTLGPRYVELAFTQARTADPHARLLYNDFNIEELNAKSDAVYRMALDFKRRGIPLDGIGFQAHTLVGAIDPDSFAANMQRFAALGLELYITEADVRLQTPASTPALHQQAETYRSLLAVCRSQPACKGFQTWGFTDKYSWIPKYFPGYGAALPFDAHYEPKPAYRALLNELR